MKEIYGRIEAETGKEKCMKQNRCHYCRKLFQSATGRSVCDTCSAIDDILFGRIEAYLKKYPNSNALQISEGLDIPIVSVIRYMDEGRLMVAKGRFERLNR